MGSPPHAPAVTTNGTSGPVSRSFRYPRAPFDTQALWRHLLVVVAYALRDNRFVLAAVRVS